MSGLKKIYFLFFDKSPIVTYGISHLVLKHYSFAELKVFNSEDEFLHSLKENKRPQAIVILSTNRRQFSEMQAKGLGENLFKDLLTIILSPKSEEIFALQYFDFGAKGFLTHDETVNELPAAIKEVLAYKIFISKCLLNFIAISDAAKEQKRNPLTVLTEREFFIMKLFIKGWRIKTIAENMKLHPSTIGTFKIKIFSKLQVDNIIALRDLAFENGIC